MMRSGCVFEVFSGIQGEGVHVGRRQVFVRFAGCNLACAYCDTPEAREPVPFARIEHPPGARTFERVKNPITAADLAGWIGRLDSRRRHHSVSLTGGEPLLAAEFIARLIPLCEGRRFHLETNGSLPGELKKVIDRIHVVSVDLKLASAAGQAVEPAVSTEFLATAAQREVFVKVVVSDRTDPEEVVAAARAVAAAGTSIPLVIQPVTPISRRVRPPAPDQLIELQTAALGVLDDVRVIPQTHRILGQK